MPHKLKEGPMLASSNVYAAVCSFYGRLYVSPRWSCCALDFHSRTCLRKVYDAKSGWFFCPIFNVVFHVIIDQSSEPPTLWPEGWAARAKVEDDVSASSRGEPAGNVLWNSWSPEGEGRGSCHSCAALALKVEEQLTWGQQTTPARPGRSTCHSNPSDITSPSPRGGGGSHVISRSLLGPVNSERVILWL